MRYTADAATVTRMQCAGCGGGAPRGLAAREACGSCCRGHDIELAAAAAAAATATADRHDDDETPTPTTKTTEAVEDENAAVAAAAASAHGRQPPPPLPHIAQHAHLAKTALAVALWFVANGCTVLGNKWVFQREAFHFPLALTAIHFAVQAVLSYAAVDVFGATARVPFAPPSDYWRKCAPVALVFCANIVAGNVSLRLVPVSFMQTVKSATPAATALMQLLLTGKRLTPLALLSLVPVVGGVALASFAEVSFDAFGFAAALLSCFLTATKFVLSAEMLHGRYQFNPIQLLYYMAPPSAALLLPLAVAFEGAGVAQWHAAAEANGVAFPMALPLLSGVFSFLLNVSMFAVLARTSSVSLCVCGNLKVVLVIWLSIVVFRNPVGVASMCGSLVAVAGCTWYGLVRQKWRARHEGEVDKR